MTAACAHYEACRRRWPNVAGAAVMRVASPAHELDCYGDGVGDGVAHRGVPGQLGELSELVVVEVSSGFEGDADLLETGADAVVETEEALQVGIAFDLALKVIQHDAASRGV